MKMNPTDNVVDDFIKALEHPLLEEIEAVRRIIKKANKKISERIKWNTPSYFYIEDLASIHVKAQQHVLVIFHHPAVVKIKSIYLEGDYKDRRMMYFNNMKEITARKKDLTRIINELVGLMSE